MVQFDKIQLMCPRGWLLVAQILANILGAIISMTSWATCFGEVRFYEFLAVDGFILGVVLLAMRVTNTVSSNIDDTIQHGINITWSIGYLICNSIITAYLNSHYVLESHGHNILKTMGAAVFFGYIALLTYIVDSVLLYLKKGDPPAASLTQTISSKLSA